MIERRAPQKRRIETHDRLLAAAEEIVAANGFAGLRVEEVVLKAGVAKGTFFSHFGDKDALLAAMIGERLLDAMKHLNSADPPQSPAGFADALLPLAAAMSSERIVFDVVIRYSGAAAVTEIGPIAQNFIDQIDLMIAWVTPLQGRTVRSDVEASLLAEGIQAFLVQAIAMSFCAIEGEIDVLERLRAYLQAWLQPVH